jgi:hypothetical protein
MADHRDEAREPATQRFPASSNESGRLLTLSFLFFDLTNIKLNYIFISISIATQKRRKPE